MLELILVLALVGVVVWAVTTYIPMPGPIRGIIVVVAVVFCLLIVLRAFGGVDIAVDGLGR